MTNPVIREVHELAQLARGKRSKEVQCTCLSLRADREKSERNIKTVPGCRSGKISSKAIDLVEETGLPPMVKVCNKALRVRA